MQYSVSVQTQLPANVVLQIAYVGNKASQLEINKSINALPAQYYNQGAAGVTFLQTQVPNPMAGQLPGSSLNSATVQRQFLLLPVSRIYERNGQLCFEREAFSITHCKRPSLSE